MALTPTIVTRAIDASGSAIKAFLDGSARFIQAMAVTDDSGNQAGIVVNPLIIDKVPATTWAGTGGSLEKQRTLKVGAGRLYEVRAILNAGEPAHWLMIFDKATAAVNADVPVLRAFIPAGGEASEVLDGRTFTNGIVLAVSTTLAVLTLPAGNPAALHGSYV